MAYGTVNADVIGTSTGYNLGAGNASMLKNRIINGAMVIDQRNSGASVATPAGYTLDRWQVLQSVSGKISTQQNQGSVTPPVGFINYLGVTSSSAYSVGSGDYYLVLQNIEGFNVADLGYGTANAKTVTISFQVYSSLIGTFGGALTNGAGSRSYPFTYTVSSANTWTTASVTIVGDTTGTWAKNNTVGMQLVFGMGVGSTYSGTAGSWSSSTYYSATGATSVVGTNGATFYITGVQLEVGSSATGFEYRQYGQELALCERYFQLIFSMNGTTGGSGGTLAYCQVPVRTSMRATPSAGQTGVFAFETPFGNASTQSSATVTLISAASNNNGVYVYFSNLSGLSANYPINKYSNTNQLTLSAEL